MSRNRNIKPEFCKSKTLNSISLESNLFFIMMWMHCDDFGTILNSNRFLIGQCFPLRESVTEKNIEKWKQELIDQKLIIPVHYNNQDILIMRSWEEHQKVPNISKRNNIDMNIEIPEIKAKIQELISDYLGSNEGLISEKIESKSPMNNDQCNNDQCNNGERSLPPLPSDTEIKDYFFNIISEQAKALDKNITDIDEEKALIDFNKCLNYCKEKHKTTKKKSYNWKNQVNNWVDITKYRNYKKAEPELPKYSTWMEAIYGEAKLDPKIYPGKVENYMNWRDQNGFFDGWEYERIIKHAINQCKKDENRCKSEV